MKLTDRDKKMLIGLGVVAGIAVLYLGYTLLFSGGDEVATDTTGGTTTASPSDTGSVAPTTPDDATATSPSPSPSVIATVPTAEGPVLSGRDFFSPLPLAETSASPSPGSTESPATDQPSTVDSTTTVDGQQVKLDDIVEKKKGDEVDMTVDGTSWPGNGVGDTFAKFYTVNGINPDDGCADFQFDKKGAGESFKLCL